MSRRARVGLGGLAVGAIASIGIAPLFERLDPALDDVGEPIRELRAMIPSGEDFDSDGLTDEQENVLGTAPWDADSDGDGYSDGEEVARQSDPLDTTSVPASNGISASMTARGEDGDLKLVICVHEPRDEVDKTAIRIGALAGGQIVSVPLARFMGLADIVESTGTGNSRVMAIELPIHPGLVHANGRVTFFIVAGNNTQATFSSAAKVDVVSEEDILLLQRPVQVQTSSSNQGQGGGTIRQPIPTSIAPAIPSTWVAGSICFQRTTVVGGTGVVLLHQVIEADCLQGWDTYCSSSCTDSVGNTFETIDPSALLGG